MTAETRTFIAPSDIVGIEYECGHCRARHLVPVERFDRVLYQCPNCREGLATATDASHTKRGDDSALHQFVDALKEIQNLSVKVRLELSGGLA
ncbi:MAG: hypothetical protein ABSG40_18955 [Terriglobales bacterium]|jgi:ribosomal protein L37AE/L43A